MNDTPITAEGYLAYATGLNGAQQSAVLALRLQGEKTFARWTQIARGGAGLSPDAVTTIAEVGPVLGLDAAGVNYLAQRFGQGGRATSRWTALADQYLQDAQVWINRCLRGSGQAPEPVEEPPAPTLDGHGFVELYHDVAQLTPLLEEREGAGVATAVALAVDGAAGGILGERGIDLAPLPGSGVGQLVARVGAGVPGIVSSSPPGAYLRNTLDPSTLGRSAVAALAVANNPAYIPQYIICLGSTVTAGGKILTLWGDFSLPYFALTSYDPLTDQTTLVQAKEMLHPVPTVHERTYPHLLQGRWAFFDGVYLDPRATEIPLSEIDEHEDDRQVARISHTRRFEALPADICALPNKPVAIDVRGGSIRLLSPQRYHTSYTTRDDGPNAAYPYNDYRVIYQSVTLLEGIFEIIATEAGITTAWTPGSINYPHQPGKAAYESGQPMSNVQACGLTTQGDLFVMYEWSPNGYPLPVINVVGTVSADGFTITPVASIDRSADAYDANQAELVAMHYGNHVLDGQDFYRSFQARLSVADAYNGVDYQGQGPVYQLEPRFKQSLTTGAKTPVASYPVITPSGSLSFDRQVTRSGPATVTLAAPVNVGAAPATARLSVNTVTGVRAGDRLLIGGVPMVISGVGLNTVEVAVTAPVSLAAGSALTVQRESVVTFSPPELDLPAHALPVALRTLRLYPQATTAASGSPWQGVTPGAVDPEVASVALTTPALTGTAGAQLGVTFPAPPQTRGADAYPVTMTVTFLATSPGTLMASGTGVATYTASPRWQQRRFPVAIGTPTAPFDLLLVFSSAVKVSGIALDLPQFGAGT